MTKLLLGRKENFADGVSMLPSFRQLMETALEEVIAQSNRAGLPCVTTTSEGGVVNPAERRAEHNLVLHFFVVDEKLLQEQVLGVKPEKDLQLDA